jgi:hypothetical protein
VKHTPKPRKPSPALIVAIAALSVSLVGTALAGPIAEISGLNKKDKRVVRKISNRIANKRITKRAPKLSVANAQTSLLADTANTATKADSAKNADSAKTADNASNADKLDGKAANDIAMWAFVNSNGTLLRSSGGVSSEKVATGSYKVVFPRSIDVCAYNATNAATDNVIPSTGQVAVALASGGTNAVRVETDNSAGTEFDDQFMLVVTC